MSNSQQSSSIRSLTGRTWVDVGVLLTLAAVGLIGFEHSGASSWVPQ